MTSIHSIPKHTPPGPPQPEPPTAASARKLFRHEDSMSPVSVMFWYRLIQWIGDLADFAEKVGDRLLLLIAR